MKRTNTGQSDDLPKNIVNSNISRDTDKYLKNIENWIRTKNINCMSLAGKELPGELIFLRAVMCQINRGYSKELSSFARKYKQIQKDWEEKQ